MNQSTDFFVRPIGVIESPLENKLDAPKQGYEGAPEAWLVINKEFAQGIEGILHGQEILVLTWFHLAKRDVLKVHPRGDTRNPLKGVFATRSPDRPNPIGIHRVRVLEIVDGHKLRVNNLEALNGTPIVDLKPVLKK